MLLTLTLGCAQETVKYIEVKRVNEPVSSSEWKSFLKVVNRLPERKVPNFSSVFTPVAEWNPSRNLPVNELLEELHQQLERRWSIDEMARNLKGNRALERALRRERMTLKQFVGLALTIGTAMARSTLRPDQDLDALLKKSELVLRRLRQDNRPFSSLSRSSMYNVCQQAKWLVRMFRAKYLKMVPPENIELVRKHWATLVKIFPDQFSSNPLDSLSDPLDEKGVPFRELVESLSDAALHWNPQRALIGHDPPDANSTTNTGQQEKRSPFASQENTAAPWAPQRTSKASGV